MLKKKRLNSIATELERLENGEMPIPNSGKIVDFFTYMKTVGNLIGLSGDEGNLLVQPMTFWYGICCALQNKGMIAKQLIHCSESLAKDGLDFHSESLFLDSFKKFFIYPC